MIQSTRIIALALAAGLLANATRAQQELGEFEEAKSVELSLIRKKPQAFKNVWVKFKATYLSLGTVHNPFFTRFTRSDFSNFAAWAPDQSIWKRKEYDNPCSTMFCAKKNGALLKKLYSLKRYQQVMLTGVVRNAWQGEPWIEVTEIEGLDESRLTTASISHMSRAWSLIDQRKWQQASIELNLASSESLTQHAKGWLHGYMGLCMMRTGHADKASTQLSVAKELVPESLVIDGWLETCAKDPRAAIDTSSRVSSIRRGDRPMWEAVGAMGNREDSMKRGGLGARKHEPRKVKPVQPGATPSGSTGPAPGKKASEQQRLPKGKSSSSQKR